ncbi:MAG: hypothetical protein WD021_00350 [Rhodothermales bacterium]
MSDYTLVIIITFIAFTALAALLLVPVYRFLQREEEASKRMTDQFVPEDFDVSPTNGPAKPPSDGPADPSSDGPSEQPSDESKDGSDRTSDNDS